MAIGNEQTHTSVASSSMSARSLGRSEGGSPNAPDRRHLLLRQRPPPNGLYRLDDVVDAADLPILLQLARRVAVRFETSVDILAEAPLHNIQLEIAAARPIFLFLFLRSCGRIRLVLGRQKCLPAISEAHAQELLQNMQGMRRAGHALACVWNWIGSGFIPFTDPKLNAAAGTSMGELLGRPLM
jgi:hypothetical protein